MVTRHDYCREGRGFATDVGPKGGQRLYLDNVEGSRADTARNRNMRLPDSKPPRDVMWSSRGSGVVYTPPHTSARKLRAMRLERVAEWTRLHAPAEGAVLIRNGRVIGKA